MLSGLRLSRSVLSLVGGAVGTHKLSHSSADVAKTNLGLCQIRVGKDKQENIVRARSALKEAQAKGANIAVLPECWNSPYATSSFPIYAEVLPEVGGSPDATKAPSAAMLCETAKQTGLWVVGGSVPERVVNVNGSEKDQLYNTCLIIDPTGKVVGKHRKVHLFDINVPGKVVFRESDTLSPGSSITTVQTPWGMLGVGICYDLRFPELATVMRQSGCTMLIYPGAFNMTTGPLHWELLQRARAVDNNVFVATCSPARVTEGTGYVAYGHSSIINPMGAVVADAGVDDSVIVYSLNLQEALDMRDQIPCWKQKRHDIYETKKY